MSLKKIGFSRKCLANRYQPCQMQQHFIISRRHILCGELMMKPMKLLVQHLIRIVTIIKNHIKIFGEKSVSEP